MSNELMVQEANPMMVEIENTNKVMGALMRLPHYKKMGEDVVFAIIAKARSLNIDPMYALNGGLFNIKGKIGMPAEAMAAMIREKGHSITKDKASTDTCCILNGRRADNGDTWTCKFSIEDAKKAGIYANSWEKYGSAMCYNRAMSFLARQLFPDVIKGAGYTMDELKEISRNDQSSYTHEDLDKEDIKTLDITPQIETVTLEQAEELKKVMSECSEEYRKESWKGILEIKVKDKPGYTGVPLSCFKNLMQAALSNRMAYQQSLTKEDVPEEEG